MILDCVIFYKIDALIIMITGSYSLGVDLSAPFQDRNLYARAPFCEFDQYTLSVFFFLQPPFKT